MNLSRFPCMLVDDANVVIEISDADSDRHPITLPDKHALHELGDGVYYIDADETVKTYWLQKVAWLLLRSGPGIDEGKQTFCPRKRFSFTLSLDDNVPYSLVDFPEGYGLFTKYTQKGGITVRIEHGLHG